MDRINRRGQMGRRSYLLCFLLFFLALVLRFGYYGATYFPQLDDYIQYFHYPVHPYGKWFVVQAEGLLAARPLAGLMDVYFWGLFREQMWLAVVLLSGLLACGTVCMFWVLRRHFSVGPLFFVVTLLWPLNFEGTYWVSASSRTVCALFFCALAACCFQQYGERGGRRYLVLTCILQFLSFGFYEQAIPLSITLLAALAVLNRKKLGRRALWGLFGVVLAGLYFFLCSFVESAVYAARSEILLPVTPYYFDIFLPEVLGQLWDAIVRGGLYITGKGFLRGGAILLGDRGIWYFLLVLALSAGLYFLSRHIGSCKVAGEKGKWLYGLLGLLLAVAPLSIFFVIAPVWFGLRGVIASIWGIAILADWLLGGLAKLFGRRERTAYAVFVSCITLIFMVGSVSELHDYRKTWENDQRVMEAVSSVYDTEMNPVAFLGMNASYLEDQNHFYHEHIHGITQSNWAFSGGLRVYLDLDWMADLVPIPSDGPTMREYGDFSAYDAIYYLDDRFEIQAVEMEEGADGTRFFFQDGSALGHMEDRESGLFFVLD